MASLETADPYNWPMPNRKDLMSLNVITQEKDLFRVKTANYGERKRQSSQNLYTGDIESKSLCSALESSPKKWVKESVNRPEYIN